MHIVRDAAGVCIPWAHAQYASELQGCGMPWGWSGRRQRLPLGPPATARRVRHRRSLFLPVGSGRLRTRRQPPRQRRLRQWSCHQTEWSTGTLLCSASTKVVKTGFLKRARRASPPISKAARHIEKRQQHRRRAVVRQGLLQHELARKQASSHWCLTLILSMFCRLQPAGQYWTTCGSSKPIE